MCTWSAVELLEIPVQVISKERKVEMEKHTECLKGTQRKARFRNNSPVTTKRKKRKDFCKLTMSVARRAKRPDVKKASLTIRKTVIEKITRRTFSACASKTSSTSFSSSSTSPGSTRTKNCSSSRAASSCCSSSSSCCSLPNPSSCCPSLSCCLCSTNWCYSTTNAYASYSSQTFLYLH